MAREHGHLLDGSYAPIAPAPSQIGVRHRRDIAGVAESVIVGCIEALVSVLLVVEMLTLFWGVIARYVLNSPLLWSDEVSQTLFVWLSMLGAAAAFHRSQHMRMTAFSDRGPAGWKAVVAQFPTITGLVFAGSLVYFACEYAYGETDITTPAVGLSGAWRAAALPAGLILIFVLALLRTARDRSASLLFALFTIVCVAVVLAFLRPTLIGLGNYNLLIFLVLGIVALVLLGIPISFSFGLATIAYVAFSTRIPLMTVAGRMDEGMGHIVLLAVPLFVFLGLLLSSTGMAQSLVAFLANLLGHIRGGLQYILIAAMYLVSGISGSKAADMAAVAPALIPEMVRRGSKPGELVALLAATGAQTETVPPSIVLIALGSVTGLSIAGLFTAGLLPSLVLGIALCLVVWVCSRKSQDAVSARASRSDTARSFMLAIPALVLPFVIRGAVVEGVATATEVSTIGIAYCLLFGAFFYRRLTWASLRTMLVETAVLSGAIMLIVGTATAVAWALSQSGFSGQLGAAFKSLPGGPAIFMITSIAAFIILGSVLEGMPAIVLFGPLLFPIARQLGIHEMHYAMVVVLAMGIGLFAPPFGVGYYTACAIARIDPAEGLRPILRYMLVLIVALFVVAAAPWLSTALL